MPHARVRFKLEQVAGRCLEELQHRRILPRRRVRHVDRRGSALQRIREPFAGDGVDAGRGRCRYYFLPAIAKLLDKLRSDKSGATDYYDFHMVLSWLAVENVLLANTRARDPHMKESRRIASWLWTPVPLQRAAIESTRFSQSHKVLEHRVPAKQHAARSSLENSLLSFYLKIHSNYELPLRRAQWLRSRGSLGTYRRGVPHRPIVRTRPFIFPGPAGAPGAID